MISKLQVIPLLIESCPSFQAAVDEHRAFYEEEIFYTLLGDFARHLLELHQSGRSAGFPVIAQLIERLHTDGDDFVKEAATIGLLEGVQNVWGHTEVDPELFASYLLPVSRRWWDELNAFWRGERRYVGEGLQREITAEDIRQIREERRVFNEKLKREREEVA
jgi:hypothetical protein